MPLHTGDNLAIMKAMPDESVDLIYLDPPFNTRRDFVGTAGGFSDKIGSNDVDVSTHPIDVIVLLELTEVLCCEDDYNYLAYMAPRILELRRLLKPTGSIYLHCDPTMSHYLKLLMDAVFGKKQFRNEVIWKRYRGKRSGATKKFASVTDSILFYSKTNNGKFNGVFEPLDDDYVKRVYRNDDQDGKGRYRFGGRIRDRKYYLNNSRGSGITNLWNDVPELNGTASEATGYPTQKPLALLQRIIKASSNEGDVVLDPFCGCATTCVAAEQLNRQWIGIDANPQAIELGSKRINDIAR